MHSKLKGNIGELAVSVDLAKKGYFIFKELGDLSKIDLIAVKENKLIRIQVKSCMEKNNVAHLSLRKSGPNYCVPYKKEDIDIFALFIPNKDVILYVPVSILDTRRSCMTFRFGKTKNNEAKDVNQYSNFLDLEKILRDFTWNSHLKMGNDKVQTTTN